MLTIKKYAVIVAGGQGTRMGSGIPKQFLLIEGKPVLYYTIQAFIDALPDIEIILVLPQEQLSYANMVLQAFDNRPEITLVAGGATRFHSVQNGLQHIQEEGIVLIHDGVRPLVSKHLIHNCLEQAILNGNAVPAIAIADSMRMQNENGEYHTIDREKLIAVQTPQTFATGIILRAMAQPHHPSFTDEATVLESIGERINFVAGERSNIKITLPEDLIYATAFLNNNDRASHEG